MIKDVSTGKIFDFVFSAKNTVFGFILSIILIFIASWISAVLSLPEAIVSVFVAIITNICMITR